MFYIIQANQIKLTIRHVVINAMNAAPAVTVFPTSDFLLCLGNYWLLASEACCGDLSLLRP